MECNMIRDLLYFIIRDLLYCMKSIPSMYYGSNSEMQIDDDDDVIEVSSSSDDVSVTSTTLSTRITRKRASAADPILTCSICLSDMLSTSKKQRTSNESTPSDNNSTSMQYKTSYTETANISNQHGSNSAVGPKRIVSTVCGHVFCKCCIIQSIKASPLCPVCRKRVAIRTLREVFL
eukprot:GHVR01098092.1.p1 GENE.GHVR01098092.1~~GHVR01098092.1.p1  ORF type:complete len:177 (+),score=12.26 GHVR01098092.1:2-532(+)